MTALSPATTRRSADHVWPLRNAAGQTWAQVMGPKLPPAYRGKINTHTKGPARVALGGNSA